MFAFGANAYGQLGIGNQEDSHLSQITFDQLEEIKQMTGGGNHTIILDSNGKIYGSGLNKNRQLFDCSQEFFTKFTRLALDEKIIFVCCGWDKTFLITEYHKLIYLGTDTKDFDAIKFINSNIQVKHISCGFKHTIVVSLDGRVYGWGSNKYGQLGIPNLNSKNLNVDLLMEIRLTNNTDIPKMVISECGQYFTLLLSDQGEIFSFGLNKFYQLGYQHINLNSSQPENSIYSLTPRKIFTSNIYIVDIKCGWHNAIVLSDQGRVYGWGRNDHSQLGIQKAKESNNLLKSCNIETPMFVIDNVKQISSGSEHSLVLRNDGSVWSWGWNEHFNCGFLDPDHITKPRKLDLNNLVTLIGTGYGYSFIHHRWP